MEKRTRLAKHAAKTVGEYVAEQFRAGIGAERKEDGTDVTVADREAEHRIRSFIRDSFPEDAIIGEEHEAEEGESGIVWFVDPIDGTSNFANGIPIFGVSIGFADEEGGLLGGAIYLPTFDSLYWAQRGKGAYVNDAPIRVADAWDNERPIVTFSVADRDDERIANLFAHRPRPRVRVFGSAAVTLAFFAEGGAQGTFLLDQKPWDYAAGLLIAKEAGAQVVPLDDKPPHVPKIASFYLASTKNVEKFGAFLAKISTS